MDIVVYVNGDLIFVFDVFVFFENKNLVFFGEEVFKGWVIVYELVDELIC